MWICVCGGTCVHLPLDVQVHIYMQILTTRTGHQDVCITHIGMHTYNVYI